MNNTLKQSFSINVTCKVNGFIYRLQKLPLIGKYFTDNLYGNEAILALVKIIVLLGTILYRIGKKALYIFIAVGVPFLMMERSSMGDAIYILLMLSIVGMMINNKMLEANMKKYYAVHLLRMDAKEYALSHFYASLLELGVIFFLCSTVLFLIIEGNPLYALPLTLFMIEIRIIGESISIGYYNKSKKQMEKNLAWNLALMVLGVCLAYLFLILKVPVPIWILWIGILLFAIPSFYAFTYLRTKPNYKRIYKETVTPESIIFDISASQNKTRMEQLKIHEQDLEISDEIRNKNGYDYFNELFFARHRRMLFSSAKKMAIIFFAIAIVLAGVIFLFPELHSGARGIIMNYLPYFVFLMYVTSRGAIVTQAMFFNCDHSMLTYKFYRDPKTIVEVFKKRLKTIIKINLLPGIVIAVALPILLFLAGGESLWIYLSLFLSILFLAIFFSVHHLVIYYLLQPYDIEMKEKSNLYLIVNGVTYFVCYICLQINVPTEIFSVGVIGLTALYIVLSLYLVYQYAPKTFKLKQ